MESPEDVVWVLGLIGFVAHGPEDLGLHAGAHNPEGICNYVASNT
jgi:hypothetical protein